MAAMGFFREEINIFPQLSISNPYIILRISYIHKHIKSGEEIWVGFQEHHLLRPDTDLTSILYPYVLVSPGYPLIVHLDHILPAEASDFPFAHLRVEED